MPTSVASYSESTSGTEVAQRFADRVKDKIILITGANPGGVGGQTAISLAAAAPKLLILAGRTEAKLAATIEDIKKVNADVAVKTIKLDLSSQESCREAARIIMEAEDVPQIDILINNAGVMNIEQRTLSPEGIEMQLATNHVGHFLFTNLIYPKIAAAAKGSEPGSVRVINLSSLAAVFSAFRFSDYNFTKFEADIPEEEHMSKDVRKQWNQPEVAPYTPSAAYGQSKTANILFSVGANRRWLEKDGVLSLAVHPGAVNTELGRHTSPDKLSELLDNMEKEMPGFKWKSLEQGCSTSLVAALDPKLQAEDILFSDCQVSDWTPAYAKDPEKGEKLWKLSEELVGQAFSY